MTPDEKPQIWPPAPGSGYLPPIKGRSFRGMLAWEGPLLCGIAGATAGAIALPEFLLLLIYLTNDAGGPLGFLFGMIVAVIVGAGAGFAFGVAAWFVGKIIVRWWVRRHSPAKQ